jgi:hypothetical protein
MRLRKPCFAILILGVIVPTQVVFAVVWADGKLGTYALAYDWPLWLELWNCVGRWASLPVLLFWYASMQRDLVWMALKQLSTLWVIAMTGVFVAALISLQEFGVRRATWIMTPAYIGLALFFPLIAMADALPPALRLRILRFVGPLAVVTAGVSAVVLRLPAAEDTPGKVMWTVMGIDTVTNLQALTYSATLMTVLLAEGTVSSWLWPAQLAFIPAGWQIAVHPPSAPTPFRAAAENSAARTVVSLTEANEVCVPATSVGVARATSVAPHLLDPEGMA